MALYKYSQHLSTSNDSAFDSTHKPGTTAAHPGIYKCMNCGDEIAIAGGHTLPPQSHKQHDPKNGDIAWKLIVYPVQR